MKKQARMMNYDTLNWKQCIYQFLRGAIFRWSYGSSRLVSIKWTIIRAAELGFGIRGYQFTFFVLCILHLVLKVFRK